MNCPRRASLPAMPRLPVSSPPVESKIRRVVLNVLYAIKLTPEGGRIDLAAVPRGEFVEVSVTDTGVGIAPGDQEAMFEEFRQVGTAARKVDRRIFLGTMTGSLLAASLAAEAQPAKKVYRIGVILSGSPATSRAFLDAFRQRFRELGYMEGRNLTIESRYAEAQSGRYPLLATDMVGLGVDVIVASGTLAARAVKQVTDTIPIVMVSVGDAVGAGLVKSLPKPGGNVTGQSFMGSELAVKGLDTLIDAFPRASRPATLFDPEIATKATTLRALDAAAHARGVTLQHLAPPAPRRSEQRLGRDGQGATQCPAGFRGEHRPSERHRGVCREESASGALRLQRGCRCRGIDLRRPRAHRAMAGSRELPGQDPEGGQAR